MSKHFGFAVLFAVALAIDRTYEHFKLSSKQKKYTRWSLFRVIVYWLVALAGVICWAFEINSFYLLIQLIDV